MFRRSFLLLALLAWASACACSSTPGQMGRHAFATRLEIAGVSNAAQIVSGVYRGAQPTEVGFRALKALGVRTVISLRSLHDETDVVRAAGLKTVRIPLQADIRGARPPSPEEIRRFLSIVMDSRQQPVFFHCAQGEDRTGTMCAIYRMEIDGWAPEDAYAEMEYFGFNHIWTSLSAFVKGYQRAGAWSSEPAVVTSHSMEGRH
jgi:protein tyrosine/serine phosphatase